MRRDEYEALLRAADRLAADLGSAADADPPGAHSQLAGGDEPALLLGPEDELLVARIRLALARIAAAVETGPLPDDPENGVAAALDGTEMVMRGELLSGNADQLRAMLPGFVFLVTLPLVDQDRALELSQRAERLIARYR